MRLKKINLSLDYGDTSHNTQYSNKISLFLFWFWNIYIIYSLPLIVVIIKKTINFSSCLCSIWHDNISVKCECESVVDCFYLWCSASVVSVNLPRGPTPTSQHQPDYQTQNIHSVGILSLISVSRKIPHFLTSENINDGYSGSEN